MLPHAPETLPHTPEIRPHAPETLPHTNETSSRVNETLFLTYELPILKNLRRRVKYISVSTK